MITIPEIITSPIYVKCVYPSYGDYTTYYKLIERVKKKIRFAYVDKWTIGFNSFPPESFNDVEDTKLYSPITKKEFEEQVQMFTAQFYED